MIAMKTPMAALRGYRQSGYQQRDTPTYLCLGGQEAKVDDKEPRGPRIINIESAPRTEDPETP